MAHRPNPHAFDNGRHFVVGTSITGERCTIQSIVASFSRQSQASAFILSNVLLLDRILPSCSPATFMRLSRVCRFLRAAVAAHITHTFDINRHLRRFFGNPLGFRSLQARTGALIAGSHAVQFFTQAVYEDSDLDIFVKNSCAEEVGIWLMNEAGYEFQPDEAHGQVAVFSEAVREAHVGHRGSYSWNDVRAVFNFVRRDRQQKVQVVGAGRTPMELILQTYSSK